MTRSNVPLAMLVVLFAAAWAAPAHAQGLGYAIAGPAGFSGFFGSSDAGFHAGGGGEVLVKRIAGAGAEFGIFGNASSALWVKSVNGVFHVRSDRRGDVHYWALRAGVAFR